MSSFVKRKLDRSQEGVLSYTALAKDVDAHEAERPRCLGEQAESANIG
jgi:hypothetical protein